MLTIGSIALHKWFPRAKVPKDLDLVVTPNEFSILKESWEKVAEVSEELPKGKWHFLLPDSAAGGMHVEVEIARLGSTAEELLDLVQRHNLAEDGVAKPEVLLALKLSHRYLKNSPHFLKTMHDIHFLREKGVVVPQCLQEWLKRREEATYNYGHPILKQDKKDFFDTPGVEYKYDHDTLHLAVARFDKPCYNFFKPDEEQVFCSKQMFFECDEKVKLGSVVEESLVLALERCLVPFGFSVHPEVAFKMALSKVCTSIASGWWREYAWENYYPALGLFKAEYSNYVEKFMDGLQNGTVKLHMPEVA